VQRVAQQYLARANRTVGHFVPDQANGAHGTVGAGDEDGSADEA
jgi:hypothetical protein